MKLQESKKEKVSTEKTEEPLIDSLQTDIDRLLSIIEERGSVNISDLSKELNVGVEKIEEWAKVLEERGLIEIEYPIIGLPRLKKKWEKKS
ncbi:MAG: hypothetical protein DRN95_06025 [Candidatus Hydrothermarchaeota archaeon]|nr:MAG: hypothetical protein DRN95_06025 [Candidatus Hydrothermarchaeota archaeon]